MLANVGTSTVKLKDISSHTYNVHSSMSNVQVFLEFRHAFWEDRMPEETGQFGVTLAEDASSRGMASTVWNFKPFTDKPILCALLIGSSAELMASMSDAEVRVDHLSGLH